MPTLELVLESHTAKTEHRSDESCYKLPRSKLKAPGIPPSPVLEF